MGIGLATGPAALAVDRSSDLDQLPCATQRVRELERSRGTVDPEGYRRLLSQRQEFPDSLETAHALILYTLDEADPDHTSGCYVSRLGEYLEHSWDVYVNDPRFEMPEAVGTGPTGAAGLPRVVVRVMHLEEGRAYAHAEGRVPGRCANSHSGSIHIHNESGDAALRRAAAHELWHVFTFGIDAFQPAWIVESTAQWAQWQVWPETRNQYGVMEFLQHPYEVLWSSWPSARTYGGVLFWAFLQERLGDPLAVSTWKGACSGSWLQTLRENVRSRHGRDLDELIVEFWQWNYRTSYADDGRHYSNGSSYPLLGYQAVGRPLGPERRVMPDSLAARHAATNAILLVGPATRENLRITFDGAPGQSDHRVLSAVATTWPNTHPLEIVQRPDTSGDCVFEIPAWHLYDQVALLMTNHESAQGDPEQLGFTWIAEEFGAPAFDIGWDLDLKELRSRRLRSVPNPFSASIEIRYRVGAGTATWLEVFDVAGTRIRSLVSGLQQPIGGDYQVVWDGTDEQRRLVAAGVYFLHLRTPSWVATQRLVLVR